MVLHVRKYNTSSTWRSFLKRALAKGLQSLGKYRPTATVTVFSSAIAEYRCVVINWCRIAHTYTIKLSPQGRKYASALTFWCLCWHLTAPTKSTSYQSGDKPDVILLMIQSGHDTGGLILCYHSFDHCSPALAWSLTVTLGDILVRAGHYLSVLSGLGGVGGDV